MRLAGEADGTMEERCYLFQNQRHDVVSVLRDNGTQVETVRYTAFGIPYCVGASDLDCTGGITANDYQLMINANASYDARADFDLSGAIGAYDFGRFLMEVPNVNQLGYGKLSRQDTLNRSGYAGYRWDSSVGRYHVRYRAYAPELGHWLSRDPLGAFAGANLYQYVHNGPVASTDSFGLIEDWMLENKEIWREMQRRKQMGLPPVDPCSWGPVPEKKIIRFTFPDDQPVGIPAGRIPVENMGGMAAELACCPDNSFDWVQMSGHGGKASFTSHFSGQQLRNIKRRREQQIPLIEPLRTIDRAFKEARRVSPNLDIYACCFARGEEGQEAVDLLKEMYGFEQVRAAKGTCWDMCNMEWRSDYNLSGTSKRRKPPKGIR